MFYSYQSEHTFNEFYDSVKSIPDNFETGEGFGKKVNHTGGKRLIKNTSVESVGRMEQNGFIPKSQSSQSFGGNDHSFHMAYGKPVMGYNYTHHQSMSTMPSSSSLSHAHIFSSMPSMNAVNSVNQNTKATKGKLQSGKKKNNGETDFRVKYKTEVCKYWAEYGVCEFGDQCAFAHGKEEIRQKHHISTNYKTKKCLQFHEQGYCPYGVRCQFIHNFRKDRNTNPNIDSKTYSQDIETVDIWHSHDPNCVCCKRTTRPRLPTFEKFSAEKLSELGKQKETPSESVERKMSDFGDKGESPNLQNEELIVRRYSISSDGNSSNSSN